MPVHESKIFDGPARASPTRQGRASIKAHAVGDEPRRRRVRHPAWPGRGRKAAPPRHFDLPTRSARGSRPSRRPARSPARASRCRRCCTRTAYRYRPTPPRDQDEPTRVGAHATSWSAGRGRRAVLLRFYGAQLPTRDHSLNFTSSGRRVDGHRQIDRSVTAAGRAAQRPAERADPAVAYAGRGARIQFAAQKPPWLPRRLVPMTSSSRIASGQPSCRTAARSPCRRFARCGCGDARPLVASPREEGDVDAIIEYGRQLPAANGRRSRNSGPAGKGVQLDRQQGWIAQAAEEEAGDRRGWPERGGLRASPRAGCAPAIGCHEFESR